MRKLPVILALALVSCSSSPQRQSDGELPAWVNGPSRAVDGGYIVHVGHGSASTLSQARFNAESEALRDLANECSFAPKGTRIEDHYDGHQSGGYTSYAKVAIEFSDCEGARQTTSPDEIKRLANVALTEQIRTYEERIGEEDAPEDRVAAADEHTGNTARVVVVRDHFHYFVVRERVAYFKQVIILAPPQQSSTPATLAATRQAAAALPASQASLTHYETVNPAVRTVAPHLYRTRFPHRAVAVRNQSEAARTRSTPKSLRAGKHRPRRHSGDNNRFWR